MQYKIIVDKQPSSNPSSEKKEYIVDIEELRVKGSVYDSINIEIDRTYVTRRLSLSEYGVLTELEEPIIQELPDLNIELFEGDNYIYLMDMQGNKFYAEYLIKNDFNDIYATKNEMNSAITQTAQSIELSVNQKLTGYSTTQEMNSAIQQSAQNINLSVNEKLEDYSTTEQMNSAINLSAQSITSSVNQTLTNYATSDELEDEVTELNSTITQTASSINSEVSKKVGKTEVISSINQSAEAVQINANKISLNGKQINLTSDNITIASSNFSVDKNGNMNCTNANVSGTITSSNATITGGKIKVKGANSSEDLLRVESSNSSTVFSYIQPIGAGFVNGSGSHAIYIMADESSSMIDIYDSNGVTSLSGGEITTPKLICPDVTPSSTERIKKNISKWTKNATEIINNADIYEYNLKTDEDTDRKMIGFVIGDKYRTPDEVLSKDGEAVRLYSIACILWKGFQEQEEKINKLMEVVK